MGHWGRHDVATLMKVGFRDDPIQGSLNEKYLAFIRVAMHCVALVGKIVGVLTEKKNQMKDGRK